MPTILPIPILFSLGFFLATLFLLNYSALRYGKKVLWLSLLIVLMACVAFWGWAIVGPCSGEGCGMFVFFYGPAYFAIFIVALLICQWVMRKIFLAYKLDTYKPELFKKVFEWLVVFVGLVVVFLGLIWSRVYLG